MENLNRMAAQATLHCLSGCAGGEVLGLLLGSALGLSNLLTVALAVVLAFAFGFTLTARGLLRHGLSWPRALRVALAADGVSISVMEIADNAVMLLLPGVMAAGLADWRYWAGMAFSLLVAYLCALPVNRWLLARGRGHAVVHHYHQHH